MILPPNRHFSPLRQFLCCAKTLISHGAIPYLDVNIRGGLGRAKPDALQGSLDLLVLKMPTRRSRLHGYAIMSAIQRISADVLRVGEGSPTGPPPRGGVRLDSRGMDYQGHWPPRSRL
jgi:hypothetical protein